jgi:predicted nucleic acid-binding Zn ribbon protein
LSAALDELLSTLQAPGARAASSKAVGGVFARWDETVGAQVAAHARPVKLDGERLIVEVDESGWATQLRFLESDLLDRLATVTGERLAGIDLRVRRR